MISGGMIREARRLAVFVCFAVLSHYFAFPFQQQEVIFFHRERKKPPTELPFHRRTDTIGGHYSIHVRIEAMGKYHTIHRIPYNTFIMPMMGTCSLVNQNAT
jgi:hypothetical protein